MRCYVYNKLDALGDAQTSAKATDLQSLYRLNLSCSGQNSEIKTLDMNRDAERHKTERFAASETFP